MLFSGEHMQIGQISELSGYSQRMIRYLEDQGLIIPERSDSNLREFKDVDLTRILKIKRLKELGFTYVEIKELIDKGEDILVGKGTELLKRHHDEATDLLEKIRQLETICYGIVKTSSIPDKIMTLSHPQRVAYRIKKLEKVQEDLKKKFSELISEVTFWKFGEFFKTQNRNINPKINVLEIFRGSSQIVVFSGSEFLPNYEGVWAEVSLPLNLKNIGQFPFAESGEFFGNYEIVIENKITDANGRLVFHAMLPYQAIFIASGEAIL
jgi:DNA-binding transcriptional MerR regulator